MPEDVKKKLFKQMITSKGAMGNGLGIYISNSVIKAKLTGECGMEDNPEGGAIFGIGDSSGNMSALRSFRKGGMPNEKKQSCGQADGNFHFGVG